MKVKDFAKLYTGKYHCQYSIRCQDTHIDDYLMSIFGYRCTWSDLSNCNDEILNNRVSSFMFSFDVFEGIILVIFIEKGVE